MITTTKTCNRCGDEKPIEEFPVRKGRLLHQCKVCTAAASRERRRRLEDKRADALSAEHERCGIHLSDDAEFFKENDRRLKRNEAQKRYRAKAKAKKASRPRTADELTEKLEETRAKIDKWIRMYVVATIGPQMCRQTALDNHNAFSVVSMDLMWQAESYWRQKYDIVEWLRRYLPKNTVDLNLQTAAGCGCHIEEVRVGRSRGGERILDQVFERLVEPGRAKMCVAPKHDLIDAELPRARALGLEIFIPPREAGCKVLEERGLLE